MGLIHSSMSPLHRGCRARPLQERNCQCWTDCILSCADARAHPWNLSTTRMPHLTQTGRLQPGRGCTSQPLQRLRNAEGAIRRFIGSVEQARHALGSRQSR